MCTAAGVCCSSPGCGCVDVRVCLGVRVSVGVWFCVPVSVSVCMSVSVCAGGGVRQSGRVSGVCVCMSGGLGGQFNLPNCCMKTFLLPPPISPPAAEFRVPREGGLDEAVEGGVGKGEASPWSKTTTQGGGGPGMAISLAVAEAGRNPDKSGGGGWQGRRGGGWGGRGGERGGLGKRKAQDIWER